MAKKRVYEIAKEKGVSSKDLLEALRAAGVDVKAAASTVDEADAARVLPAGAGSGNGQPPAAEAAPKQAQPPSRRSPKQAQPPKQAQAPKQAQPPKPPTDGRPPQQARPQAQGQARPQGRAVVPLARAEAEAEAGAGAVS